MNFSKFATSCDIDFWKLLVDTVVDKKKASAFTCEIFGTYSTNGPDGSASCLFELSRGSLDESAPLLEGQTRVQGSLISVSSLEEFKKFSFLRHQSLGGARLLESMFWGDRKGSACACSFSPVPFSIVAYSDVKKFKFYYWSCFSSLLLTEAPACVAPTQLLANFCSQSHESALAAQLRNAAPSGASVVAVDLVSCSRAGGSSKGWRGGTPVSEFASSEALVRFLYSSDEEAKNRSLAVADPSPSAAHAGWPARNVYLLACALLNALPSDAPERRRARERGVCLLALRGAGKSRVMWLDPAPGMAAAIGAGGAGADAVKATGLETNPSTRKLRHRVANLASALDPADLASRLADLNLNLIKWRVDPALDLARLRSTRALLVGAGTLGCSVSRQLLAWGVRDFVFVDNGFVSHSNPVRQSLYEFADVTGAAGGRPLAKVEAACRALKRILPAVSARAVHLTIPMPGHRLGAKEKAQARRDVERLAACVAESTVMFILTDSRESRWLPALLAAAHATPAVSVALAYDAYVVMRHGLVGRRPAKETENGPGRAAAVDSGVPGSSLGCYFCNDVTAPRDSMSRQSLDMRCSVTRPGVGTIASAFAVDLYVSLLHAPQGFWSSPSSDTGGGSSRHSSSPLGACYHQLRGALARPETELLTGFRSHTCVACSAAVLEAYRSEEGGGADFVLRAVESPELLEAVSGAARVQELAAQQLQAKALTEKDAGEEEEDEEDFVLL